jgi:hypothetical protein
VIHRPQLVAELRELPPEDGWARSEATGRACLVCPCGTNTGFTDQDTAAQQYVDHPQPAAKTPDPLQVDVRLVDVGSEFINTVRRMIRREK